MPPFCGPLAFFFFFLSDGSQHISGCLAGSIQLDFSDSVFTSLFHVSLCCTSRIMLTLSCVKVTNPYLCTAHSCFKLVHDPAANIPSHSTK